MSKFTRREFVALMLSTGAFANAEELATPDGWFTPQEEFKGYSILQGMTDDTTAQFSIVLPVKGEWRIEALGEAPLPIQVTVHTRPHSEFAVHKVRVSGLTLVRKYKLRISEAEGGIVDEREFRALQLGMSSPRIAFVSCVRDHMHRNDMWRRLSEQKPDLIFFVGDNVYADRRGYLDRTEYVEPDVLWDRYIETRNQIAFYFQEQLTPVLAIWDDHDFGGNNLGAEYKFKNESKEIFEIFFAQADRPSLVRGPGIARKFSAFGADFLMLDGRSFKENAGGAMWGANQARWLESQLNPRPTILLNGIVFFGAYAEIDSVEGQYKPSLDSLLALLKRKESLAAFVSGDVHFSEVMALEPALLGHPSFELVSSSMHSLTFPGHHNRWTNERRRDATSSHNFVLFEGEFRQDEINGVATSHSARLEEFKLEVQARR